MPILNWLTREEALLEAKKVPFRLLEEVKDLSYGDETADNLLVQGNNLDALKALMPMFAGRVKCIYIDPPYNTGSAFEQYDDNLEHSTWLSMMWPRLELLREFLRDDGSIWVSVDDNQAHYLKVIMDEIFGRENFIANVVWQKRISPDFRRVLGDGHENIMVYGRDIGEFLDEANLLPLTEKQRSEYRNPDNDPRGPWVSRDFTAQGYRPNQMYKIVTPGGAEFYPPPGYCWKNVEDVFLRQVEEGRFWFGREGTAMPRRKNYLSEAKGRQSWTWWPHEEVGNTQDSKRESIALFGPDNVFATPKPEKLIHRVLHIATNPGDLVLDSFLGSGTTAAVAHKMSRRYIGIEMGDHAVTHCVPRLQKVVDGEQGGISEAVGWKGGGGFRFHKIGSPLLDEVGSIRSDLPYPALAAYIWFSETGRAWDDKASRPVLGIHKGTAYALLYDMAAQGRDSGDGQLLTRESLEAVRRAIHDFQPDFAGPIVVYGEQSRMTPDVLAREGLVFKQLPYDVKTYA